MTGSIGYLVNGTLKFSLLFMVEKRKLDHTKLTVSVQSSTPFLNFMVTTGIDCHPDQFPNKNTLHPTIKDKDGNPMTVKDICTHDHQRVQDLQDQGYNVEIIWGKDWQALLTQRPDIKSFRHNITLILTSKSI